MTKLERNNKLITIGLDLWEENINSYIYEMILKKKNENKVKIHERDLYLQQSGNNFFFFFEKKEVGFKKKEEKEIKEEIIASFCNHILKLFTNILKCIFRKI